MTKTIQNLIAAFKISPPKVIEGDKIKVNQVVSKASFIYEKIRNAVDYNEEHLIRKIAIYRIMKRKLMFEKAVLENYMLDKYHSDNVAEQLLQELIRGKYIDEKTSVKMIPKVDEVIQKYNQLITKIKEMGLMNKKLLRFIMEIEAVEIENTLIPDNKQKALARAMFSVMNPRIILPSSKSATEKQKELQLYVACYRSLFKWDDSMVDYMLLKLYYPNWQNADDSLILRIANNIEKIKKEFEKQRAHPWTKRLANILQRKSIVFWVLQDVIEENKKNVNSVFADQEELENEIKKACNKRYKGIGVRLRRGVVRSIIYVFFTKMLLALALELPLDIYLAGVVNYFSLAINILFPPLLMLLVAIMIRLPKKENTKKIISEINMIVSGSGEAKKHPLKDPRRRGKFAGFMFDLVYAVTFVFSLMVIFWGLNKLDFNVFSSLIFVMFLTLVSFFGIRIRRPVHDVLAIERRDSAIASIIDFVALPFVSTGRWFSVKFTKFNFFAFFLDFIIEAPFKLLLEIFEDLFTFYREKKEDMMQDQT